MTPSNVNKCNNTRTQDYAGMDILKHLPGFMIFLVFIETKKKGCEKKVKGGLGKQWKETGRQSD